LAVSKSDPVFRRTSLLLPKNFPPLVLQGNVFRKRSARWFRI